MYTRKFRYEGLEVCAMGSATYGDLAAVAIYTAPEQGAVSKLCAWWRKEDRGVNSPYTQFLLAEFFRQEVHGGTVPPASTSLTEFLRLGVAAAAGIDGRIIPQAADVAACDLRHQAELVRVYNRLLLPKGEKPKYELAPLLQWREGFALLCREAFFPN